MEYLILDYEGHSSVYTGSLKRSRPPWVTLYVVIKDPTILFCRYHQALFFHGSSYPIDIFVEASAAA